MLLVSDTDASGWIVSARYGDRVLVICPGCMAGAERARAWSRLPDEAQGIRLETLRVRDDQVAAVRAIVRIVQARHGWLTLAGGYGTGKTTLLYATLNELAVRGQYGRYETAPDLLEYLRDGMADTRGASPSARMATLIAAPVLAIDEIDKYQATPFAEQAIFRLFDARYRARATHVTLLAYNRDGEERIPPFLLSRAKDGRFAFVVMGGADIRPALRKDPWDRGEDDDAIA